jgi:iron complex outermembrane recepter protein
MRLARLANIPKVRSRGFEFDAAFDWGENIRAYASGAWTEGEYVTFPNGPCPLELIGASPTACNLSGKPLPGHPAGLLQKQSPAPELQSEKTK